MHRLLYFVFNIYKQIVIYGTCVDHQLVNTQNLRGSDLLRWSNGFKTERWFIDKNCQNRNCQSLRHDKAHPYLTGTSETIFAHSYSLKSLSPLPFSLGETLRSTSWNEKRWDWKKLAAHTNDLSSSLILGLLFQQFYWLFFKVMNLWNAKNFIYIIKSRGLKDS